MAHSPSACRTRILRLFYFFLQYSPHHPHLHSFPTRRSSDLYRGGFARHRAAAARGRDRGHGGAELRPGPELRRAVCRRHRHARKVRAADAGPLDRPDHRPCGTPRVRANARHARGAHPPREGDLQHLHQSGALRAGRRDSPVLARQRRTERAGATKPGESPLCCSRARQDSRRTARVLRALLQRIRGRASTLGEDGQCRPAAGQNHRPAPAQRLLSGAEQARPGVRHGNYSPRGNRAAGGVTPPDPGSTGVSMTDRIKKASRHTSQSEGLIFEKSAPGKRGIELPRLDVPAVDARQALSAAHVRETVNGFPEVSEIEVIRHFTRLSTWNYAIDLGMYPLGSCTMKYNPRVNEFVARLDGIATEHPFQPIQLSQGCLKIMQALQNCLLEITGMYEVTFEPSSGA